MSALAGGVSAGVGASGVFDGIKSSFLQGAAQQATSNFLTQGIATATGLQDKFDWAGVAVAGVVGGVSAELSRVLPESAQRYSLPLGPSGGMVSIDVPASELNMALSSVGGGLAGAMTRSVVTGTSFGDNLMAVLPDVIGSTIGNFAADGLRSLATTPADNAAPPPAATPGAAPAASSYPTTADYKNTEKVKFQKYLIPPSDDASGKPVRIKIGQLEGGSGQLIAVNLSQLPRRALEFIKDSGLKFVAVKDSIVQYMPGFKGNQFVGRPGHGILSRVRLTIYVKRL